MWRGISLANKCLLVFGAAVVLIVGVALSVPWLRMNALVDEGQLELSRRLLHVWEELERTQAPGIPDHAAADAGAPAPVTGPLAAPPIAGIDARRLTLPEARAAAEHDPFVARALRLFERDPRRDEWQWAQWRGTTRQYRYARPVRRATPEGGAGSLVGLLILERESAGAAWMLLVNTAYLISAGAVVLGLAVLVFYQVTHRLILSPVRDLRRTAEEVREGNLSVRSDIRTGDEFEELSHTFNAMLGELQRTQEQLRAINAAMDLKLNELAESNVMLHEAARLKGDFLANVSHELRTPLNSIIGFAELLAEIAQAEADAGDDSTRLAKRRRYVDNILQAGRGLLDLINGLLEMAKIEAGRVQVHPEPMSVKDACEGLLGLIAPLADKKGIELRLEVADDVPIIETDPKKFQQILFNLLSNAVKFTEGSASGAREPGAAPPADNASAPPPRPGRVTLRAERLVGRGVEDRASQDAVRISVIDTGPGIAPEDQRRLFQKFEQLEGGHTKGHTGTGLGLAISRQLASLLQGEIQLVSEVGRGSMFSLILPLRLDRERAEEQKLESAFKAALAGAKSRA